MPVEHYENFPVASLLCPAALRPAIEAIYAFARTADDIADEGDAAPSERLAALAAYRAALADAAAGRPASGWPQVFVPLAAAIARHRLPVELLDALLDAFIQDVTVSRYADRPALLDYCRRSANPVGRLLLHLYGVGGADDAGPLRRDLQRPAARQLLAGPGRRHPTRPALSARRRLPPPRRRPARRCSPARTAQAVHRLVIDAVAWARELMLFGAPLVHAVPGRAGWELRLVVQGGLRVLERIDRLDGATLQQRPKLGWTDAPAIAWRALAMRRREKVEASAHAA